MNTDRIIFAGTPSFSAVALKALLDSNHEVIAVYTQPDRPAGRGQKLTASPVKTLAVEHDIPIYQPVTLRSAEEQQKIIHLKADVMVVVAYGLILPKAVLEAPRLGCINIHASLLPRWRGAAPIQRAILEGDTKTGITLMQMDEGLDTGPILHQVECAISPDETSETLYEKLAALGAKTLLTTLNTLREKSPLPQDKASITYAHKIQKEEALLDWNQSAEMLDRYVRGLNPWPICYFMLSGERIRVLKACVLEDKTRERPGTILRVRHEGIDIATREKSLRLLELQFPGGKPLPVSEILKSKHSLFKEGYVLGSIE